MEITFGVALLGAAVTSLVVTAVFYATVFHKLRPRPRATGGPLPPLSVLKPLKGADVGLLENLRSLALQDYAPFELVFGVEDAADPALEVVAALRREFPNVPITVSVSAAPLGFNPKVSNLAHMCRRARYDHWLVSDANVRAAPTYLRAVVAELADARVGLVCNVLAGTGARTLGATFDQLHMNAFVVASICAAETLAARPCVIGKSMLMHRDDLQALGGWAGVRDILAEDYVLGERFARGGWKVAISSHVLTTHDAHRTVASFADRHVRWGQMRRHLTGFFWGEPLLNPAPWALLALAAETGPTAQTALAVLATKLLADALLARRLTGVGLTATQVLCIIPKDCLVLGLWCVATFRRSVTWRGHRLRIGAGTLLSAEAPDRLPPPALAAVRAAARLLSVGDRW
jgi:ceramide glucosyltransferase